MKTHSQAPIVKRRVQILTLITWKRWFLWARSRHRELRNFYWTKMPYNSNRMLSVKSNCSKPRSTLNRMPKRIKKQEQGTNASTRTSSGRLDNTTRPNLNHSWKLDSARIKSTAPTNINYSLIWFLSLLPKCFRPNLLATFCPMIID